jgi:hypothetical protein
MRFSILTPPWDLRAPINKGRSRRALLWHLLVGSALGIFVLHPLTMAIYWIEYHGLDSSRIGELWTVTVARLSKSFSLAMAPMTGLFCFVGAAMGLVFWLYYRTIERHELVRSFLERELSRDLPTVLAAGEGETVEFKTSARWDVHKKCVNKSLAFVVVKTIAGFLNHEGGSLLLGVDDEGIVVGLKADYGTLRRRDRDGYEQFIMALVRKHLGGDVCSLLHTAFLPFGDLEICRIVVEPAPRPVYCIDGSVAKYFLRTGNGTRELDAKETMDFVIGRWPEVPPRRSSDAAARTRPPSVERS